MRKYFIGVDFGEEGDRSCAVLVRQDPDGHITILDMNVKEVSHSDEARKRLSAAGIEATNFIFGPFTLEEDHEDPQ